VTDEDDPLADFSPDDALERMRELAGSEDNANEVVKLFTKLDSCIVRSGGTRLPLDWQYEPAVHLENIVRRQPRRTSRQERRR
jgi:hypothetical protein